MPRLACLHRDVLSGERRAKADAYMDVRGRATQDAKAEKRKINESSGRLFLGTFFGGAKKVPRANVPCVNKYSTR